MKWIWGGLVGGLLVAGVALAQAISPSGSSSSGSGTVNTGTTGQAGYYAAAGTEISGTSQLVYGSGTINFKPDGSNTKLNYAVTNAGEWAMPAPLSSTNLVVTSQDFVWNNAYPACCNNRAAVLGANAGGLALAANWPVAFSSANAGSGDALSVDTGISRIGAAQVAIGNGTAGSFTGLLKLGNLTATSLTTGTNADFLCLSSAGVMLIQTSACTISSARFKDIRANYGEDAMAALFDLKPVVFTMKEMEKPNADQNYGRVQIGLTAENVAAVEPRCAIYEADGKTPKSYRQECLIAVLVAAFQEQQREIAGLKAAR